MSAESIAKCLKQEEECRQKAALSRHTWDEVLWLRLAEDFKLLADEIKRKKASHEGAAGVALDDADRESAT
jgi:hypothetical protein